MISMMIMNTLMTNMMMCQDYKRKSAEREKQLKTEYEELRLQSALHRSSASAGSRKSGKQDAMETSKVQYVRQMLLQYLSCPDAEVRQHIERALVAMFRYDDQEKRQIAEKKSGGSLPLGGHGGGRAGAGRSSSGQSDDVLSTLSSLFSFAPTSSS